MRWRARGGLIVFAGLILLWIGARTFVDGPYMLTGRGPIVLNVEVSPGVFGAAAPLVIRAHQRVESTGGRVGEPGQIFKWHWTSAGYGHLVVQIIDNKGNVVISKEGFSGTITVEAEPGTGYWIVFRNAGDGDITLTEACGETWSPNTLYPYCSALIALGAFAILTGVWVATRASTASKSQA